MGDSLDYSRAEAFQDYVREFAEELFIEMFYGFKTADLATMHEGIKGEKIFTQLEVADNLARRWAKSFDPVEAAAFKPRKLKTVLNKVDFSIVPTEYESSYLGMFRKKGQSVEDWPFQAFIMEKVMAKLKQEFEVAAWQGVEESTPSAGDYLRQTFDGYLQVIADALTAGDIDAVTTGAISTSNVIDKLRLMWAEVDTVYKENGIDIFVPYAIYDMYRIAYKDAYKVDPAFLQVTNAGYNGIQYELGGGNAVMIPVNGMGSSGRVVMTPRANLAIGIDSPSDVMFNVEKEVRELKFWMDFRMGAQIMLQKNGILVVNDQA